MPNTRSKSRNIDGTKSKYMRYKTDDRSEVVDSSCVNEIKNCMDDLTDLSQQGTRGLYKFQVKDVHYKTLQSMYILSLYFAPFLTYTRNRFENLYLFFALPDN